MKTLHAAAISTGPDTHLDHLAPICALMNIPLIVVNERHALLAKEFYPGVEVECMQPLELSLDFLASRLDVIYECGKFWALDLLPLLQLLYQKKLRVVFCPHGNSDKERSVDYKEKAFFQDISLIYGNQMRETIQSNQSIHQIHQLIEIGNVRLSFYLHHKKFFDEIAEKKVFSRLDRQKKTILYSPTWHTSASPSSFFDNCHQIVDQLSTAYNLIVKLHPLLEEMHPAKTFHVLENFKEKQSNVLFLNEFPAIYPLLEKIDLYIGDFSSIGYDFLFYDRPMIFLKPENQRLSHLQRCGYCIDYPGKIELVDIALTAIESGQKTLSGIRRRCYLDAFGELVVFEKLAKLIKKKLHESLS